VLRDILYADELSRDTCLCRRDLSFKHVLAVHERRFQRQPLPPGGGGRTLLAFCGSRLDPGFHVRVFTLKRHPLRPLAGDPWIPRQRPRGMTDKDCYGTSARRTELHEYLLVATGLNDRRGGSRLFAPSEVEHGVGPRYSGARQGVSR